MPTHLIGNDAFQECDTTGITRPCTKHNYLVKDVNRLARTVHEAFYVARSGRPGPVVVDLPKDVCIASGTYHSPDLSNVHHKTYRPRLHAEPDQIRKAVDELLKAKRPVIYSGGGVVQGDASEALTAVARKLNYPVTNTLMGLGAYPGTDKQFLGMLGMHGTYEANMSMHNADVILAAGARLDDRVTNDAKKFCPGAKIGLVQRDTVETDADFVICMLQSISQKEYTFEQFESIGTLIVDEAHHICARVFSQALFKMCPKHVYGLSATPDRKDGLTRVLHWFMGPTFFAVERKEQTKVTVTTIEFMTSRFKDPPPTNRAGKLSLAEMITNLVEMPQRNDRLIKLIKRASKGGRMLLVLSDRRLYCEYLNQQFPGSGLYMGGMSEEALEESSKCPIIFGTFSQAHEGLDIPTLDTLILATPKSDIKQSIGRILRETPGKKNEPHIWDIRDNWSILNSMYYKRRKVYIEGGFTIEGGETEEEKQPKISGFLFRNVVSD